MFNEIMFCPKCGKSDQKAETYCRQCGEFLPDVGKNNKFAIGGNTPEKQIQTNLFLNLLSAVVSICSALTLYLVVFFGTEHSSVILAVAGFLLAMSGWQFSTFAVGLKLKKNFAGRKELQMSESRQKSEEYLKTAETKSLLNKADYTKNVPATVTENTTRKLSEKIKRRSS